MRMDCSTNALRSWLLTDQRVCFLASRSHLWITRNKHEVRDGVEWVMRRGILNLQGALVASKTIISFHTTPTIHRPPFLLRRKSGDVLRSEMADDKKQTDDLIDKKEKEKEKDEAKPEIPSPPEKPLPGDCCGSGCVRCVWDVYYEELEEYNNRLKNIAESKS